MSDRPLRLGTRLGPYEIQSDIGAGGMGEVYKARDTRLDRTIAIKILPHALAADPVFRERFDREAKAIAALTHPHICTLYDVGQQDGTPYLVMEYLEGETLAHRLEKGALSLDQALRYAIEVADVLDAAHRAGIVHRDLKPGNIMLTKVGTKLLDFGLAKATVPVEAGSGLSMLPTPPPGLTAQGTLLGTFQYMAPEQLEGQEADTRTDIFAFGAVVYEMLTGKKAFDGKSQASLISAIMSSDPPPIATSQPSTPPPLERVVKKCLAKPPRERWQSAKDLHDELQWIADSGSQARVPAGRAMAPHHAWLWVLVAAVVALLAAVALWAPWRATRPAEQPLVRLDVDLGPDVALAAPILFRSGRTVTISPDGTRLVYLASAGSSTRLFTRRLDQRNAAELPGTEDASLPFFSPDGRWVGFFARGTLNKISVDGGAVVPLGVVRDFAGASWAEDGTIILGTIRHGLIRMSSGGGTSTPVIEPAAGEYITLLPEVLPGGKAVLFTATHNRTSIKAMSRWCPCKIAAGKPWCEEALVPDICRAAISCTATKARCSRSHLTQIVSRRTERLFRLWTASPTRD
jgi:serine/threonine-protein kinase